MNEEQSAVTRSREADAQVAVLGSMLIDEECVPVLMRRLSADDFPDSVYRHVFEAIRELWLGQKPVDPVTVLDRMGREYGELIRDLMALTPTAANCEAYADILQESRMLTRIQDACRQVAYSVNYADAYRALGKAAALLLSGSLSREATWGELARDYVLRQKDPSPPDYIDFGIPEVTAQVHISPGRFIVLGADSSVGKTALALQFARHIAKSGKRVGFFSYETALEDAADRLMSNAADIKLSDSKAKKLPAAALARAEAEAANMGALPLKIMETADYTVDDIRTKTLTEAFRVIFIDYVQLIPTEYREAKDAVSYISKALHRMAQQLGVTVIALSQVTMPDKKSDGSRRYISKEDLRESKQLKMDAEAVLLLDMWDTKTLFGDRILIVGKNKDGPLGNVRLSFDAKYMRFSYKPPETEKPKKKKKGEEDEEEEDFRQVKIGDLPAAEAFQELNDSDDELPF